MLAHALTIIIIFQQHHHRHSFDSYQSVMHHEAKSGSILLNPQVAKINVYKKIKIFCFVKYRKTISNIGKYCSIGFI